MDCKELRALATKLEEGSAADIWCDVVTFGDRYDDVATAKQIEETQTAMAGAARFLKALADLIE